MRNQMRNQMGGGLEESAAGAAKSVGDSIGEFATGPGQLVLIIVAVLLSSIGAAAGYRSWKKNNSKVWEAQPMYRQWRPAGPRIAGGSESPELKRAQVAQPHRPIPKDWLDQFKDTGVEGSPENQEFYGIDPSKIEESLGPRGGVKRFPMGLMAGSKEEFESLRRDITGGEISNFDTQNPKTIQNIDKVKAEVEPTVVEPTVVERGILLRR